ncbi:hypothetical protein CFP65_0384 [Kitasatospora sp. MMS16-BH015]|uniref:hypothetical protein n=1 Tax=Kitasatospora sp. MMS16-BH015 TaxID=2018025 RepID=UPI000CA247A3|nr:hypothetical protein CFP65_0384 [Kitasatospora sp. MMS16-BH015]
MRRFRRWYGSSPLHLLALAGCFALAWYAGSRLLDQEALRVALWFAGAAVVHDLLLFPLYSAVDRGAQAVLPATTTDAPSRPAYINYLRFPAFGSAVLFLVWLPLILGLVDGFAATTGLDESVFLPRWLLVTAILFALSALVLGIRLLRDRLALRRREGQGGAGARPRAEPGGETRPAGRTRRGRQVAGRLGRVPGRGGAGG